MRATKFIFVTFWLIILINASDSHNEHDEHDYHNDGEDHIEHHVHEHKLSSNQKLSQIIQDLKAYCQAKIPDDSSNSSTNTTIQRNDDNFTSSICRSFLDVDDSQQRTSTPSKVNQKFITPSTWGYAILACVIISLVGLLAVAIIPLMHRVIYNHLLQFLVSLAIGSLAGDAFLHLIPHALVPHEHDHHQHHEHEFHFDLGQQGHDPHHHHGGHDRRPVWLGLMALGGLFMFFIVERLVGYCSEMKRKKNKGEKYQNNNPEPETSVCLKTSDVNTTNGMMMMVDAGGDRKEMAGRVVPQSNGSASCEEMLMVVHASKDIKKMAHDAHEEVHKNCDPPASADHMVHQRGGHHHHSHEVPGSVAAVAWMVIVGDGFHNFADGIAIGSAFASSIQDGLSTAIAIFCHELPHELGDFAMLLSAGMSGKQALVYNCVSSILCLVGMCVGVGVSNLVSATPWIFMTIAGMFIYIALVDMLPEMKSVDPKRGEHPLLHLGLQVMGMLTGSSIMLIIALFEHQITIPM